MDQRERLQKIDAELQRLERERARILRAGEQPQTDARPPAEKASPGRATRDTDPERHRFTRGAVVFLMAVMALGAVAFVRSETGVAWHRVVAGYGVALGCLLFGWVTRARHHPFSHLLLGVGLAALYLSSYAAFFGDDMRIFREYAVAGPLMATCLVLIVASAHGRRSPVAAGIGLFFVFYTVLAACVAQPTRASLLYALVTLAALAVAVLVFHAARGWRFFTWFILGAVYGTYYVVFWWQPTALAFSPGDYAALTTGLLSICFLSFALALFFEERRRRRGRASWAALGMLNLGLYVVWALHGFAGLPGVEWTLRAILAVGLLALAVLMERFARSGCLMGRVYLGAGMVLLVTVIPQVLPPGERWTALALCCLGMAVGRLYVPMAALNWLTFVLMWVAGAAVAFQAPSNTHMAVAGVTLPLPWFSAAGVAGVLAVISWVYTHGTFPTARRQALRHRVLPGIAPRTMALFSAGAAALTLVAVGVFDLADNPRLPFLLGMLALAVGLAGWLLRTPAFFAAALMLFGGAHAAFHALDAFGLAAFEQQPALGGLSVGLAALTLVFAGIWERQLPRGRGMPWDRVPVWIAHALAAGLLAALVARYASPRAVPPLQGLTGVAILLAGMLLRQSGYLASGLTALGLGTATFFLQLYAPPAGFPGEGAFLLATGTLLTSYASAERLLWFAEYRGRRVSRADDFLRILLVATAGAVGILAINQWAPNEWLTVFWLGHATLGLLLGLAFRESRYRWAALLIFALALTRATFYDLLDVNLGYQLLALFGLLLLVAAGGHLYLRYRGTGPGEPAAGSSARHDG